MKPVEWKLIGRTGARQMIVCLLVHCLLLALTPATAKGQRRNRQPELTAEAVRNAVERGKGFLRSKQRNGSWTKYRTTGDVTALCALALLNAEDAPELPHMKQELDQIISVDNSKLTTYFVSLRIMALATADPAGKRYKRKITSDALWLIDRQVNAGVNRGGWDYVGPSRNADASNSQFALLALHEASRMGVDVPRETWEMAKEYWTAVGNADGGFGYRTGGGRSTGSMTCAGISSWLIINENLDASEELVNAEIANCCQANTASQRAEEAIEWMANHFRVTNNPGRGSRSTLFYYLYGMERAGRLAGRRFFGAHDWYRAGAAHLLDQQNRLSGSWRGQGHGEDSEEIATALALLFLAKGKRPIAIGKVKWHDDDRWDLHPKGVHFLTRHLEDRWQQRLNWQTVRTGDASVNDLLEAPVLFFSGRELLQITDQEKQNLKTYLDNGGFLFAEACQGEGCGQAAFDQSFRELMAELFPDSQLEPLPPDHPIWRSSYPLIPDPERPLLGLQACCRTSVVYCPANLSCYWSLDQPGSQMNARLRKRMESCLQIGVNVVTYATGRELQDKGDTPKLASAAPDLPENRLLILPKLEHGSSSDDAPNAWRNILRDISSDVGLRIDLEKKSILPQIDQLADHPFIFFHGRSRFEFDEKQTEALANYLRLGGFIFADSICSSEEFTQSFRREIRAITGSQLAPIDPQHRIWTDAAFGRPVGQVELRVRNTSAEGGFQTRTTGPLLEGVEIDGRLAVVFSPYDLSCAMENTAVSQCTGYTRSDASLIATHVILYSLLDD